MQLWIYKVTFKTVRPNVFCLQLAYNTMLLTLCGASGAPMRWDLVGHCTSGHPLNQPVSDGH